ncbi:amidohydrolase [Nocardioides sp. BYT-33-1]|uniref:amidohydrolase n=1 Tax=Nocardioides sp. BYT-33-1 TaxID=3416952 RepID=UPI003F538960
MRTDAATPVDVLLRVGAGHTFDGDGPAVRAVALGNGRIRATSTEPDGLDALTGPGTRVVDDPDLVVLPAFSDTHMHLEWAAADALAVPLADVTSLEQMVGRLAERAVATPPGDWVIGSADWHESGLAEGRMPTVDELDRAAPSHPVVVRRGGHNLVANSVALARAGIVAATPDPPGGRIMRFEDGRPTGWLMGPAAMDPVTRLLPEPTLAQRADSLAAFARRLNSHGIAAIRDAGGSADALDVYQAVRDRDELSIRTRMLALLPPAGDLQAKLAEMERWPVRSGFGDDWLRIEGLKVLLDGGVEGGALEEPYAHDPGFTGHLLMDPADLETLLAAGLGRGWRFAVHTVGDRALRLLLDAYERVSDPGARRPGALTVEHAMLAPGPLRHRVRELGVHVTVQYMLLHRLGANAVRFWGRERAEQAFPIRSWVEEGVVVASGSDAVVASWDVLAAIAGMETRATAAAGPLGLDQAIDRRTALELATSRAADLVGDGHVRGRIRPGLAADLVLFRGADPLSCPVEELPALRPALTLVGGRPVHDPEGLLP